MDVNKAVRFVMDDKQWINKLLIGAVMSVLGFLILPALIFTRLSGEDYPSRDERQLGQPAGMG